MILIRYPTNNMPTYNTQSGNILIYILGAIFLLGILIVTVRGSSTPGGGIDEENLILRVAEVQQYGAELESAVAFILQKGFSESDIRFAHPDAALGYGLITDNPERQIFSREGGGATYREPPNNIQVSVTPWLFNAENKVWGIGTTNTAGTDDGNVDLIVFLPNVTEEFCIAINDNVGITNPLDSPPVDVSNAEITLLFTGTYQDTQSIHDAGSFLDGNQEGCFEGGGTPASDTFHYYRVLLAR